MVTLRRDHGVNPSVYSCFYCNKDIGVVLVGNKSAMLFGTQEAPRRCVVNKQPCDECKAWMEQGIILISVRNGESGDNPYRTGGWVVLKEDALRRLIQPPELVDAVCKQRVTFIDDETWDRLGLPRTPSVDAPG